MSWKKLDPKEIALKKKLQSLYPGTSSINRYSRNKNIQPETNTFHPVKKNENFLSY
jgi:hypothetical protein